MIYSLYVNNSLKFVTNDRAALNESEKRYPAHKFNVRIEGHGETSPLYAHFKRLLERFAKKTK